MMKEETIRKAVSQGQGNTAGKNLACCVPGSPGCETQFFVQPLSERPGYGEEILGFDPKGANSGFGCGNSFIQAALEQGDVALVLGFHEGFDYLLAANEVGQSGKVIGVDMNPEMLDRARESARKGSFENLEFRLGEIENLPVANNLVNIIFSNCATHLASDKERVIREAFRVLRPWGRLMASEVILQKGHSEKINLPTAACFAHFTRPFTKNEYLQTIRAAGFKESRVIGQRAFSAESGANNPAVRAGFEIPPMPREKGKDVAGPLAFIQVSAVKPPFKWMSAYLNHWLG